ncbi:MAG: SEC-C domain-containing protein, partial [Nocardioidaceae bacterium]
FSWGLTSAHREDPEEVDHGCLNGRFRVRRQLELPHDRYDELCEEIRRGYEGDLLDDKKRLLGSPEERSVSLVMLYWPAEEFGRLLERYPEMAEDYGSEHDEHRSNVERRMRELSEEKVDVSIGVGNVAGYLAYAKGRGNSAAESSTRAGYAAHLGFLGRGAPWPPGRNERCWCGSGLKYKKCCGALRFAAPE